MEICVTFNPLQKNNSFALLGRCLFIDRCIARTTARTTAYFMSFLQFALSWHWMLWLYTVIPLNISSSKRYDLCDADLLSDSLQWCSKIDIECRWTTNFGPLNANDFTWRPNIMDSKHIVPMSLCRNSIKTYGNSSKLFSCAGVCIPIRLIRYFLISRGSIQRERDSSVYPEIDSPNLSICTSVFVWFYFASNHIRLFVN